MEGGGERQVAQPPEADHSPKSGECQSIAEEESQTEESRKKTTQTNCERKEVETAEIADLLESASGLVNEVEGAELNDNAGGRSEGDATTTTVLGQLYEAFYNLEKRMNDRKQQDEKHYTTLLKKINHKVRSVQFMESEMIFIKGERTRLEKSLIDISANEQSKDNELKDLLSTVIGVNYEEASANIPEFHKKYLALKSASSAQQLLEEITTTRGSLDKFEQLTRIKRRKMEQGEQTVNRSAILQKSAFIRSLIDSMTTTLESRANTTAGCPLTVRRNNREPSETHLALPTNPPVTPPAPPSTSNLQPISMATPTGADGESSNADVNLSTTPQPTATMNQPRPRAAINLTSMFRSSQSRADLPPPPSLFADNSVESMVIDDEEYMMMNFDDDFAAALSDDFNTYL